MPRRFIGPNLRPVGDEPGTVRNDGSIAGGTDVAFPGGPTYNPQFDPNQVVSNFHPVENVNTINDFYRKVADEGIFGQEGIDKIMTGIRGARQRSTLRLQAGLRKRAGRRLGTRSGAVDQVAANAAGGAIAGEQQIQANLQQANILSKLQGVSGLFDLARLRETRRQFDEGTKLQRESSEGGGFSFMDILETGIRAVGGYVTGGASEVAIAGSGSLNNPRGST